MKDRLQDNDVVVLEILVRELGFVGAATYARKISQVQGGHYSAQYRRVADELDYRMNVEFRRRLILLGEIAKLPGYHPVEGDLGSVPL